MCFLQNSRKLAGSLARELITVSMARKKEREKRRESGARELLGSVATGSGSESERCTSQRSKQSERSGERSGSANGRSGSDSITVGGSAQSRGDSNREKRGSRSESANGAKHEKRSKGKGRIAATHQRYRIASRRPLREG